MEAAQAASLNARDVLDKLTMAAGSEGVRIAAKLNMRLFGNIELKMAGMTDVNKLGRSGA